MVFIVKVSVIIPTYNYGEFLSDSIESAINQTYKDFEIIVIDDGSTDNTSEIVNKYKEKISYFYKENGGPSSARNLGIEKSKGKYICFLDADDTFLENKLEQQINYMEEHSKENIGLIYSDYYCVSRKLRIMDYYKSVGFSKQEKAIEYLLTYNYINTSTVMISKRAFDEVGLFNENYRYLEDYDLWLRIGCKYKFGYINKSLVKTRSHFKNFRKQIESSEMNYNAKKIKEDVNKYMFSRIRNDL